MACTINITPKFGPNTGKEVQSSLFDQIIELIKDPKLAQDAYEQVRTPEFIEKFGDWINDPASYAAKLDDNGEPILVERDTEAVFPGLDEPIVLKHFKRESTAPTAEKSVGTDNLNETPNTKAQARLANVIRELNQKKNEEGLTLENPGDSEYKGNTRNYKRLTSEVKKIVGKDVELERARNAAETLYNNLRKDQQKDTITIENKELSFEELVEHYERKFNTAAAYGRAIHKYLEYHITKDRALLTELAYIRAAKTKEKDGVVQDKIDAKATNWVTNENVANLLTARSGYTSSDQMAAEVMIHSDILGIATQVDGLYSHDDNTISLVDWKSGAAFLNDKSTIQPMPYARGKDYIGNSRLNQAKLELALRALIIKEQVPDAKFRNLTVHHIERNNLGKNPYRVDLQEFLGILKEYFKATAPEKFRELDAKGLFDYKNYKDFEAEADMVLTKYKHLPTKDQIPALENEAILLRNRINTNNSRNIIEDKRKLGEITAEILMLKDHTKGELDPDTIADSTNSTEGMLKAYFGTLANMSNKHIQQYNALFQRSRKAFLEDKQKERRKADKLFKAVQDEYYRKNPLKGITRDVVSFYDYKDVYGFAFKFREDESVSMSGFYRKTMAEAKKELANGEMTQAQYNLLEYLDNTWRGTWSDVMLNTAYTDRYGKEVSYARSIGLIDDGSRRGVVNDNGSLSEMFVPRLPKEMSETGEEYSGLLKPLKSLYQKVKMFARRNFTFFEEENYYAYGEDQSTFNAVKVRYMGSEYSIAGQQHSFNLEKMHADFMVNMYQKKYMDNALAMADGLKSFYEAKAEVGQTARYAPVIEMLDKHIVNTLLQELGYRQAVLTKKQITIPALYPGGKVQTINLWKGLMALKNLATAKALWLKAVAGTFNGLLITFQTAVNAASGSISKRVLRAQGLSTDDIDFTISDLLFGVGEMTKYYADILNPLADKRDNKMYNLLQKFNYLPDNYDYASDPKELRMTKNSLFRYSNLFFFHSIHEEWGHGVLLAAQMRKIKMADGSNIWDSYNDDGSFKEFKEDGSRNVRGLRKGRTKAQDEVISDLTAEELNRMYKASTLIHGAYRSWERAAIESYVLGQWFLQFKKYLPAILFREWEGRHEDFNLGYFKYADENGNRKTEIVDGVELDVMEWHSAMHEGRARVMGGVLLAGLGMKSFRSPAGRGDYRFSQLSGRDKVGVVGLTTSLFFSLLFWIALGAYFEDDEDNPYAKRFGFLAADGLQGFNPREVLRTVKNPLAVITQLNNLADGLSQMIVSGVSGDFTGEGKLKGQNQVMKEVPFLSIQAELERYELVGGTER